ncbi:MAG: hypothetical protein P8Y80_06650 [Acidobacteriota bacterium]|jgi:hypothetical protein
MERRIFFKAGAMSLGVMAIAKKSLALEYYPKKSDKKWAVVYSTLVEPQYVNMVSSFGDYDFMKRADFLEFGKTSLASVSG